MVSIGARGDHYHPTGDPGALASGRLSPLLAVEIPLLWRPAQIDADLRALIRRMSGENSLWGAPRIHGELLKLGLRGRSVERREVHGQAMWTAVHAWRT